MPKLVPLERLLCCDPSAPNDPLAAKDGDLMLFGGDGSLEGDLVQIYCNAPVTHVGILVRDWETGRLSVYNAEPAALRHNPVTNKRRRGTQLNDVESYVKSYAGRIYLLRLKEPLTPLQRSKLQLISRGPRLPFNGSSYDLFRAVLGFKRWLPILDLEGGWNGPGFFCSQLVADTLMSLGLIDETTAPSTAYNPSAFVGHPLYGELEEISHDFPQASE